MLHKIFLLPFIFMIIDEAISMESTSPASSEKVINEFQKNLEIGKSAIHATDPKKPSQRILLVPSHHHLNIKYVDPRIVRAMEKSDVLIAEIFEPKNFSPDDKILIKNFFSDYKLTDLDKLKDLSLIKPTSVDNEWKQYIDKDKDNYDHLNKIFGPYFPKIPINDINPGFLLEVVGLLNDRFKKRLGMDAKITSYFFEKNKPICALESADVTTILSKNNIELFKKSVKDKTFKDKVFSKLKEETDVLQELIEKKYVSNEFLIKEIKDNTNKMKENYPKRFQMYENIETVKKKSPNVKILEVTEELYLQVKNLIERNQKWIPELEKHLKEHNNKSLIFIVVGGEHFLGKHSILNLLKEKGFTFTHFSERVSH